MTTHTGPFPGFPPEPKMNFWLYPKALNGWWKALDPYEQKVLDYILRHTWGYQKNADAISLGQFLNGIKTRDGREVDGGTGIKDERTIRRALKNLVVKGFILATARIGYPTVFSLRINPSQEMSGVTPHATTPPASDMGSHPSHSMSPTIKNEAIKTNNNGDDLLEYLSQKFGGMKLTYLRQQRAAIAEMMAADYTKDDIKWAIDRLYEDDWWRERSFDMVNVAKQIPMLMNREFRVDETP